MIDNHEDDNQAIFQEYSDRNSLIRRIFRPSSICPEHTKCEKYPEYDVCLVWTRQ